jgi:hypothetical protein
MWIRKEALKNAGKARPAPRAHGLLGAMSAQDRATAKRGRDDGVELRDFLCSPLQNG